MRRWASALPFCQAVGFDPLAIELQILAFVRRRSGIDGFGFDNAAVFQRQPHAVTVHTGNFQIIVQIAGDGLGHGESPKTASGGLQAYCRKSAVELPDIPAAGPVGIEFVVKFDPLRGAGLGFDVDRIGQFVLQHQDRLRIEQAQLGADVKIDVR